MGIDNRENQHSNTIKRRKTILAVLTAILCVCIAAVIAVSTVIIPKQSKEKDSVSSGDNGIAQEESGDNDTSISNQNNTRTGNINSKYFSEDLTISAGDRHTVGLKSDGTVVATQYTGDYSYYGECDVSDWTDIVAVSASFPYTVGLKSDGTVVATGHNDNGQCDVSDWTDIVAVSAGSYHTVGLKFDGTVIATKITKEYLDDGQCDVSDWTDIVAVSAGDFHTVGLKSDGTVVATGYNDFGQCDVSD